MKHRETFIHVMDSLFTRGIQKMVDCRYSSEVNKTILNMCAGSLMFPCKVKEVADWNIVENNCKTSWYIHQEDNFASIFKISRHKRK